VMENIADIISQASATEHIRRAYELLGIAQ
jgi:hypothetical protein